MFKCNLCLFLLIVFLLSSVPILNAGPKKEQELYKKLLMAEYKEHPEAAIQDMYKFVHQSAMGPGHWKMEFPMAKQYLMTEIESLHIGSVQTLFQFLSPDSELVRVNIFPYLSLGGNIDSLAMAFVKTSNEFVQSEKSLENKLSWLMQMVNDRKIPFPVDSVQSFFQQMKASKYPAVHHTTQYEKKYAPAYRVVFRKYLPVKIKHATY